MMPYQERQEFFDETARPQIECDFDHQCVLCKNPLKAGEGHFVPLLYSHRVHVACIEGLYTSVFAPCDAANGLYACKPCAQTWIIGPDDDDPLIALVPCIPIMNYIQHVLRLATDEASRSQTVDAMLEDLERYPDLSPERRMAAPFLHCYQICPVNGPDEASSEPTHLRISSSLFKDIVYEDRSSSKSVRYRILKPSRGPASGVMPSRTVPLHGQCEDGAVTLWCIPNRSTGLLLGYADSVVIGEDGNPELYKVFDRLCTNLKRQRGLPAGYKMEGAILSWWDLVTPWINTAPASIDSIETSD